MWCLDGSGPAGTSDDSRASCSQSAFDPDLVSTLKTAFENLRAKTSREQAIRAIVPRFKNGRWVKKWIKDWLQTPSPSQGGLCQICWPRLHLIHSTSSWEQNMPFKRSSDCKTISWIWRVWKSNSWPEVDCTRLSGHPLLTQTWYEHITSSLYDWGARCLLQNSNTEKFVVCDILISWAEDYLLFSVL